MSFDFTFAGDEILVVAEIGLNHEGNFEIAKDMIASAAKGGAHAVKFQTIVPEKLVSIRHKSSIDLFRKFQFSREQFSELKQIADAHNVMFLSTPFDSESVLWLDSLVPAFKIASSDNNYWPLIETVAGTGKPIILSTGMANLEDIGKSKKFIEDRWKVRGTQSTLVLLHCVSLYPTPPELANLLTIRYLSDRLGGIIGYSDHTVGIDAAVLAVALGARVIEKHFTLDKNFSDFPDHAISMDAEDLSALMKKIKSASTLLGSYEIPSGGEQEATAKIARRSIVAQMDLTKGTVLGWKHLDWVRPAGGLSPGKEDKLIGKSLNRNILKGQLILAKDVNSFPTPNQKNV